MFKYFLEPLYVKTANYNNSQRKKEWERERGREREIVNETQTHKINSLLRLLDPPYASSYRSLDSSRSPLHFCSHFVVPFISSRIAKTVPKASLCFVRSIDTPIPTLLYFLLRSHVSFLHAFACALSEIRRVLIRRSDGRQTMTATTAVGKPSERVEQSMTVSFSLCCFFLPAIDARFHAHDIANNAVGAVERSFRFWRAFHTRHWSSLCFCFFALFGVFRFGCAFAGTFWTVEKSEMS